MSLRKKFSILLILLVFAACEQGPDKPVNYEHLTGIKGLRYLLLEWNNLSIDITGERPDKANTTVQICIPVTPPDSTLFKIRHFHCLDGVCCPKERYNRELTGGVLVKDGKLSLVFPKSEKQVDSLAQICAQTGADFIQLNPVLKNGEIQALDNHSKYQCRAIVSFKDGRLGIIETEKHNTAYGFAQDLLKFGVENAVFTATGLYDEGWYQYAGVAVPMGRLKTRTRDQENWLILSQ